MELGHVNGRYHALFQLLAGADAEHMAILAHPYGQRHAPVALAGYAPVSDVFYAVFIALVHPFRNPLDRFVLFDYLVFDARDVEVPLLGRLEDKRAFAPPAEGVLVGYGRGFDHKPLFCEVVDDERVRILDKHAFVL